MTNTTPPTTLAQSLAHIRKNYENATLDEAQSHAQPIDQFAQWLNEAIASHIPEPNAMTLATVGSDLRPSTRIVLIKDFDERGMVWFTNYQSQKGVQLAGNPFAALQFHWIELERMVRIEGLVEKVDAATSNQYFNVRPLLSRLAAIASPQSARLASRHELDSMMEKASQQYGENPIRPEHWGGYRLVPDRFEFWQGRRNRLHDRLIYEKENDHWLRSRLAP
ncbi:MAG: pyridoxamine 5'-phosphate oxidase [Cytophagales bacterium]|nr:pyridoxamine 5'-phosphate oxidase [Cytophagales bacterium]